MNKYSSNKTIPLVTWRDKKDYVLIACLYCWHQWISKAGITLQDASFKVARWVISLLLPKRIVYKAYRNHLNQRKYLNAMFRDLEYGQDIRIAQNMVWWGFCGYWVIPIGVLGGTICSLLKITLGFIWNVDLIVLITILMTGTIICWMNVISTKVIDKPAIYLSYFKKFEKNNKEWLIKWKKYTIMLYLCGILSAIIGIRLFFSIIIA